MKATLTSVTLLTPDLEASARFYQQTLGMQPASVHRGCGGSNLLWLQDRMGSGSLLLGLQGPPFTSWVRDRYNLRGPHISHIAFQADDLVGWCGHLKASGTAIKFLADGEPQDEALFFEDDTGIAVRLVAGEKRAPATRSPTRSVSGSRIRSTLHHASIHCHENTAKVKFYRQVLSMEAVYEIREDAVTFMGDASLRDTPGRSGPMLEIMGQAGHWQREQAMMFRYGWCLDHLSFLVEDVDATYERLRARGCRFEIEPTDYGIHRVAFFQDPNGVYIEIENAVWDDVADRWRANRQTSWADRCE